MRIICNTSDESDNSVYGKVHEYIERIKDKYFFYTFEGLTLEITRKEYYKILCQVSKTQTA